MKRIGTFLLVFALVGFLFEIGTLCIGIGATRFTSEEMRAANAMREQLLTTNEGDFLTYALVKPDGSTDDDLKNVEAYAVSKKMTATYQDITYNFFILYGPIQEPYNPNGFRTMDIDDTDQMLRFSKAKATVVHRGSPEWQKLADGWYGQ